MLKSEFLPPFLYRKLVNLKAFVQNYKFNKLIIDNDKYRGIHRNHNCYILGSGPSIKKQDLKILKNQIVISLNNFFVHPDYNEIVANGVSNYHVIAPTHEPQTEKEWVLWLTEMELKVPINVKLIFGLNSYPCNVQFLVDKYSFFQQHEIIWYCSPLLFDETLGSSNNIDIASNVFGAEAVSVYALIVSIYMGFDNIYLLGMDHDYFLHSDESKMRMYSNADHQNNEFERTFGKRFYTLELHRQYKIFCKYEFLKSISKSKIYNATEGGILKVFPLVKLIDTLNEKGG